MAEPFHPELRRWARLLPTMTVGPVSLRVARFLSRLMPAPRAPRNVSITDEQVDGVRVRVYRPVDLPASAPAMLWIHGGGMILGTPEINDVHCASYATELGILIASVDYRLAPEHPFPAALDDCYAALRWLSARHDRVAIAGASAGGGLAATLAQIAHDRPELPRQPVLQVLIYPMLDDRTATRTDIDASRHRLWNQASNVFGWTSYLAQEPGLAEAPPYAVAARRTDLAGLPPAWLGVGTCDLFHDEGVAYAGNLMEHGVACELVTVPGAFHAFDVTVWDAPVSRSFRASFLEALRRALFTERRS